MINNNKEQQESEYVDMGSDEIVAATRNHLVTCPHCSRKFPISTEGRRFIAKDKFICDPNKPDRDGKRGCGKNVFSEWERILKGKK
jgi:hypothetical protein